MQKINRGDLQEVDKIEYQLRSSLKPISPHPNYINSLHTRLTDSSRLQVTFDRNKPFRYLIFGVVGLVSFLLIMVTTLRMLLSILGILGLVRYTKRQKRGEKLMSSHSKPAI
jgi:hypothetical protein